MLEGKNSIKDFGLTIDQLYAEEKQLEMRREYTKFPPPNTYTIHLVGRDEKPDCAVSSFSGNFYFRTYNGLNRKKYKSIESLQKAVISKFNKVVIGEGEILFYLAEGVTGVYFK